MPTDYLFTQKAILVEEVSALSKELGRPVCSADLLARWREYPECRPLLTQSVGQLLLKAARPCKRGRPILFQVGVIGRFGFYAANQNPKWRNAFRQHEIGQRAALHMRWEIPNQAVFLLGTEYEASARNAFAGFVEEWGTVVDSGKFDLPDDIHDLLAIARKESHGKFQGRCPALIGRDEAQAILVQEMEARNPLFSGSPSTKRYLADLHFPQASLFSETGYWEEQVRLFCAARWPLDEDSMVARARWICGVYGKCQ